MQKATHNDHLISAGTDAFSFDTLVHEVDAIVEDLRWLHLELTLRNRCNEILFDDRASVPALFSHALSGLCSRLGAYELIAFVRDVVGFRIALREAEPSTPWGDDSTPWIDAVDRWFDARPADTSVPQAVVNHYSVDMKPITSIAMPVRVGRRHEAVLVVVVETSPIVPRVRKLLVGLSGSLGLGLQYCRDAESAAREGIPSPFERSVRRAPSNEEARAAAIARHLGGALVVELDHKLRVRALNGELAHLLGVRSARAAGRDFADLAIPPAEQVAMRDTLLGTRTDGGMIGFRIRTADGTSFPAVWIVAGAKPAADAGDSPIHPDSMLVLVGTRVPQEVFDATTSRGAGGDDTPMLLHARLAKQYRFMMKYVPFPVLHLDARDDVIRNANPAFIALIASEHWEGVPLADFGTLTVHEGQGDTLACTLRLVSAGGITITCRGIMTTLLLFGKPIREIKLDPVDA